MKKNCDLLLVVFRARASLRYGRFVNFFTRLIASSIEIGVFKVQNLPIPFSVSVSDGSIGTQVCNSKKFFFFFNDKCSDYLFL